MVSVKLRTRGASLSPYQYKGHLLHNDLDHPQNMLILKRKTRLVQDIDHVLSATHSPDELQRFKVCQ
jgi:hypothetical protein